MKKLFIPYDLSVKLKEKGFQEPCFGYYNKAFKKDALGFSFIEKHKFHKNSNDKSFPSAPTYDQVIDWFITKHKIQLKVVAMDFEGTVKWYYECQDIRLYKSPHIDQKVFKFKVMSPNISNTYRSALKKAIKEAIKTI